MGRGTRNNITKSSMNIGTFKIEEKKWDKRERANLENAINFMSKEFGDISNLIGTIYRRSESSIHAHAAHDHDGLYGRGRATYFSTGNYMSEETIIHEFTHAVTEHIASYYRALDYDTRSDLLSAMRTEIYTNLGETEPKYDKRKWRQRPEEFLSLTMEGKGSGNDKWSKETLKTIKKWYRRVNKLKSKKPKPTTAHIILG